MYMECWVLAVVSVGCRLEREWDGSTAGPLVRPPLGRTAGGARTDSVLGEGPARLVLVKVQAYVRPPQSTLQATQFTPNVLARLLRLLLRLSGGQSKLCWMNKRKVSSQTGLEWNWRNIVWSPNVIWTKQNTSGKTVLFDRQNIHDRSC